MANLPAWQLRLRIFVGGRRLSRVAAWSAVFTGCLFIFSALTALSVFDRQHNHIVYHYVQRQDDVALLSTTMYNRSKSFANNTIVMLFVAHQVFHYKHSAFRAISTNSSGSTQTTLRVMPVIGQMPFYCKWVPFIAIGQVAESATSVRLSWGGTEVELPTRLPYAEKHPVVSCFSPLFLNERWQLLLLTAQVYTHYGAFLHFYVRSMIADLFDLLENYDDIRVTPWAGIRLGNSSASGPDFKPDLELEFRNQAGAMTDCLLMYKESAQFIMFPDPDDIIIPRLDGTYHSEFAQVFALFPEAAAIAYNMSQTEIHATNNPERFSVERSLRSIRFRGETRWGKLVVRPERTDSVWIHRSYGIRDGYEQITLPVELNCALHLRFWNFSKLSVEDSRIPVYDPLLQSPKNRRSHRPLFTEHDLEHIQEGFSEITGELSEIYERLPKFSIYYPLIEKCYDRIFYNGQAHATCKGPEMCELPEFPGVRCMNVVNTVESFASPTLFLHIQGQPRFVHSKTGCSV